jgi:hypothetical protein
VLKEHKDLKELKVMLDRQVLFQVLKEHKVILETQVLKEH